MTVKEMKQIFETEIPYKDLIKDSGIYVFHEDEAADISIGISYENDDDGNEVYVFNLFLGADEYVGCGCVGIYEDKENMIREAADQWNRFAEQSAMSTGMKKEKFISALTELAPGCTQEMAETWVRFATDNVVDAEQFVDFAEGNPAENEAAIEDWLASIYAGIGLIKQRFGADIALQVASLAAIPCCLYPHEMFAAAKYFADGGTLESIPDMVEEGSLDNIDEAQWPMFPKIEMLSNDGDCTESPGLTM